MIKNLEEFEVFECPFGNAVFGKENLDKEAMIQKFPELEFQFIKQIHSDIIVEASAELHEADGHYSVSKNQALSVQTADCVPAIILGPNVVASVHAGWRGIAANILGKTIQKLHSLDAKAGEFFVFIGPHIQAASFEVGKDVAQRLAESIPHSAQLDVDDVVLPHPDQDKARVCLKKIALAQLSQEGVKPERIEISSADTFKDAQYHSYRREKSNGRQWSFGWLS